MTMSLRVERLIDFARVQTSNCLKNIVKWDGV